MAILARQGCRIALPSLCRLGRALDCAVEDPHPSVSRSHAEIRWSSGSWWIRDLNSRNGTHVRGERLGTEPRGLILGDTIRLGDSVDEWELVDTAMPRARARLRCGTRIEGEEALLALPSDESPAATVFATPGGWVLETKAGVRQVADGEEVELPEGTFVLELPAKPLAASTTAGEESLSLRTLVLQFCESRDAEYVQLSGTRGAISVDFGHRAHHELLVHLARIRLRDLEAGLPEGEAGWIYLSELSRALGRDECAINLHVYRARRAFHAAGIPDASDIVQRRQRTGQIRVGSRHLVISRPA